MDSKYRGCLRKKLVRCFRQPWLHSLHEQDFSARITTDKIFASCWLSTDTVCCGSKDNKLLLIDVENKHNQEIPLPYRHDTRETGGCGIHSIQMSGDGQKLATSGQNPNDVVVFSIPDIRTLHILEGHSDWVFDIQWIDDNTLLSASRDHTVRLWRLEDASVYPEITTVSHAIGREHTDKVRAMVYMPEQNHFATVSPDKTAKIWDVSTFHVTSNIPLTNEEELVCISHHKYHNVLAVGALRCVLFLDPRSPSPVCKVASHNGLMGVRSVGFVDDVCSIGGGLGRLSFFDMRASRYIPVRDPKASCKNSDLTTTDIELPYYQMGEGRMVKNSAFYSISAVYRAEQAVFTHCYDPTESRLFVAGGPIAVGLSGCYTALWL